MSPRAAARLPTLGFTRVFDCVPGKADWGSFNLPLEGREGTETRAGAHVRSDTPTCRLDEPLREVCERIERAGWDTCFVVDEAGVVIGRLGRGARLEAMVKRMREQNLSNLPVTRSDGRLVGLLVRAYAERALADLEGST